MNLRMCFRFWNWEEGAEIEPNCSALKSIPDFVCSVHGYRPWTPAIRFNECRTIGVYFHAEQVNFNFVLYVSIHTFARPKSSQNRIDGFAFNRNPFSKWLRYESEKLMWTHTLPWLITKLFINTVYFSSTYKFPVAMVIGRANHTSHTQ